MGREAAVTPEQVHAAADAIKAEGGKPTLRSVRERLGTGSMGTINKYLQGWKAGQERQQAAEPAIPPALQRAVLDFMATELAAARAPLEAELEEQRQAVADLARENERQASTIEDQARELDDQAAEKAAAEGKAEQLAADLAASKEEAGRERQAAEAARTELTKAGLRLEALPKLEAELTALREELTKERQARIEAEQLAAVLGVQKADLEGRLADAKMEAERGSAQLQRAMARVDLLTDKIAEGQAPPPTKPSTDERPAVARGKASVPGTRK
ncbi:DNA-binding protein [Ralstonia pseudosolanacearum]|uniref:DNA-binding protein n=1 Tax=Ralstonia pseudosolanacearum TaxID=1310165 RepID=UPI001C8BAD61|nr:DNA-binding protein [Ralstonia pseudosolanacearum]MBX9431299.1 DNA-binding protein [Ralstonia pseudosolanacearum]